jgi:hypothetical protein
MRKEYNMAEGLHQRALRGKEKALGPEHPTTLQSVNNLAHLRERQEKYIEAAALSQRALTVGDKSTKNMATTLLKGSSSQKSNAKEGDAPFLGESQTTSTPSTQTQDGIMIDTTSKGI